MQKAKPCIAPVILSIDLLQSPSYYFIPFSMLRPVGPWRNTFFHFALSSFSFGYDDALWLLLKWLRRTLYYTRGIMVASAEKILLTLADYYSLGLYYHNVYC